MAQFAKEANKAAKSLSTTTNEYAKASLIFYQQGLTDNQVAERTNITIKMANVAGDTAEKVSDQLTAVWNNFYDGTKSLEYYADAMTALGAATASSTDEIADGLEKFAAIAENVGLSYEYAAAALATVTATTRQSADVVGTAFKTLFARLEDLELGKTLEDGTSLGKYSAALNAVGVNIKDTNGQLKDMDTILNELGAKWSGLSKDTQIALAETVAGTRQYTQLMALMNNWEYFK
jgi:TP901 family phage tail tape measure protein